MQLTSIIEALLIASPDPLSAEAMATLVRARIIDAEAEIGEDVEAGATVIRQEWMSELAGTTAQEALAAIEALNLAYTNESRSFSIMERAKGWKIYTLSTYGDFVKLLFPERKSEKLRASAMEALAIIAYRQPISKSAIEAVRGVSSDGVIQKLLDRDLIAVSGRADLPGRPLLYSTTEFFLEHFGIRHVNDLPNSSELRRIPLPQAQDEAGNENEASLKRNDV